MARLYPEAAQSANITPVRDDSFTTPPPQNFDTPAMNGSMQQLLSENLGQYVVIEFLIGTQNTEAKGGILYAVGTSVVTLYQELTQTFVACDMFSIKFVTFYLPGHRPWQVNFPRPNMGIVPTEPQSWGMTGGTGMSAMPGSTGYPQGTMSGGATGFAQSGMPAPGFAPPMDMSSGMSGCVSGNCGGGATGSWG